MTLSSKTYIFRSREQADFALKHMADLRIGFGVDATTPLSFVTSKWELWGDGRNVVSSIQRRILIAQLLSLQSDIPATAGSVDVISSFVQRISGTVELANALNCIEEFDASNCAVLRLIQDYLKALHNFNLIEPAEAASIMSAMSIPVSVEIESQFDLPVAVERFFHIERAMVETLQSNTYVSETKFLFATPTGSSAIFSSLVELIDAVILDGCEDILIFAKNPKVLFEQITPFVRNLKASVTLETSALLSDTQFGRALLAVRAIQENDGMALEHAVDFAYSKWSGIASIQASKLDTNFRSNRLTDIEYIEQVLCSTSCSYEIFTDLIKGKLLNDEAIEKLQSVIQAASGIRQVDKTAEIAALRQYCEILEQLHSLTGNISDAASLLGNASVSIRNVVQIDDGSPISLVIRDMQAMNAAASNSFDAVIVADASEDAIDLSSKDNCLAALEMQLGFPPRLSASDEAKYSFVTALLAAKSHFACIIPKRNADGKAAYPSFVVEDLLSQLTGKPVDVNQVYDAILAIDPSNIVFGEDDFVLSVGKCLQKPHNIIKMEQPQRGHLRTFNLIDFLKTENSAITQMPILSPSAIEKYVHCPYSWFIDCRIAPSGIDEGFGALEMGTFVHEVMAEFYARGKEAGYARAELMDNCDGLLDEVFEQVLSRQFQRCLGRRFVPLGVAETIEVKRLQSQLHFFVNLLKDLPQAYIPEALEMSIDADERLVYAGAILNGRIDRVDVDENGNFVIFDYKGSIAGHALGNCEQGLDSSYLIPQKTQALIYAQAYKKTYPDLKCAAALYLSYRAQKVSDLMAGAYDPSLYNADKYASKSSRVCNMADVLDNVETSIKTQIENLVAGDISISPDSKNICEHCSFVGCEGVH
ncbi:PD-(D/E)XK nuclease family protein [Adlercreutzia sp. ZJ304]|uniref:PD-(D/E)XK nuclease family protein n=1 Tax=Adlercreutzia sp. ZJ304 TaxID=2709791 RepID=UPI0013EC70D7|nr:PD-(D/E)XK nuclease family protein [Adlercreutzia sp. ZJ304]